MKKNYTVNEALEKLKKYCVYQERCHAEVKKKLYEMGMIKSSIDKIIGILVSENFLNESRFANQFVSGKFNIKGWGKYKIINEMKIKSISDYDINNAISKINRNDYLNKIQILSEKKLMQLEKYTTKKKKEKLYNFLNYRGWEIDLINEQIKKIS